jgi:hypothetical protein
VITKHFITLGEAIRGVDISVKTAQQDNPTQNLTLDPNELILHGIEI